MITHLDIQKFRIVHEYDRQEDSYRVISIHREDAMLDLPSYAVVFLSCIESRHFTDFIGIFQDAPDEIEDPTKWLIKRISELPTCSFDHIEN